MLGWKGPSQSKEVVTKPFCHGGLAEGTVSALCGLWASPMLCGLQATMAFPFHTSSSQKGRLRPIPGQGAPGQPLPLRSQWKPSPGDRDFFREDRMGGAWGHEKQNGNCLLSVEPGVDE